MTSHRCTREPQRVGTLADRLGAILADRGIDPTTGPRRSRHASRSPPLELADARIPARYRNALADHPQVTAWVTRSPAPDAPALAVHPASPHGPSLLIAGPTGTGKTHQAYGAVRSLLGRRGPAALGSHHRRRPVRQPAPPHRPRRRTRRCRRWAAARC